MQHILCAGNGLADSLYICGLCVVVPFSSLYYYGEYHPAPRVTCKPLMLALEEIKQIVFWSTGDAASTACSPWLYICLRIGIQLTGLSGYIFLFFHRIIY